MWLLFTFGITFVLGTVLLVSTSVARLYRGDVKLRPWDAAKKAVVLFVIIMALWLLARLVYPSEFDLTEAIVVSALVAISSSLYTTAYRKPA